MDFRVSSADLILVVQSDTKKKTQNSQKIRQIAEILLDAGLFFRAIQLDETKLGIFVKCPDRILAKLVYQERYDVILCHGR